MPGSDQKMGLGQFRRMLGYLMHPAVAAVILVAIFLNMVHRVVATIFPLYGVELGLGLTEIGAVLGSYALCNAIVRPFSGGIVRAIRTPKGVLLRASASGFCFIRLSRSCSFRSSVPSHRSSRCRYSPARSGQS